MDHAEESHFAHLNLLKKGASEMEPHLRKYLKDKSKKPRGSAENTFNTGLQRLAGGKYMAEHSGFEQTTGNGINTLLHFEKVAEIVENVYPEDNPLHQKIKTAFVGFRKVAKLLYPFLTYTKSQKKSFLELLDPLLLAWNAAFPDKKYSLKLYHIMTHLPDFVENYGILGRVSEESFEAVHMYLWRESK